MSWRMTAGRGKEDLGYRKDGARVQPVRDSLPLTCLHRSEGGRLTWVRKEYREKKPTYVGKYTKVTKLEIRFTGRATDSIIRSEQS